MICFQAAIRFHRIDANQNGYICCKEAYEWNKAAFREAAKKAMSMIPGTHDPLGSPCPKLESSENQCKNNGTNCWPSYLDPKMIELKADGRITPNEFEDELNDLEELKLIKFMQGVQKHPIMHNNTKSENMTIV